MAVTPSLSDCFAYLMHFWTNLIFLYMSLQRFNHFLNVFVAVPSSNLHQVLFHQIKQRSSPDSQSLSTALLFGFNNALHFKFRYIFLSATTLCIIPTCLFQLQKKKIILKDSNLLSAKIKIYHGEISVQHSKCQIPSLKINLLLKVNLN